MLIELPGEKKCGCNVVTETVEPLPEIAEMPIRPHKTVEILGQFAALEPPAPCAIFKALFAFVSFDAGTTPVP